MAYMVTCTDEMGNEISTFMTSTLAAAVQGLRPYSKYMCSIAASTNVGYGPEAYVNFTTAQDSKIMNKINYYHISFFVE